MDKIKICHNKILNDECVGNQNASDFLQMGIASNIIQSYGKKNKYI